MATLQVRIDDASKSRADELFSSLGMDTPTAVRVFISAALENDGFPFAIRHRGQSASLREAIEETLWFAEDPNRMERLRQSERDEASGRVTEFASVADLRKAAMADA